MKENNNIKNNPMEKGSKQNIDDNDIVSVKET